MIYSFSLSRFCCGSLFRFCLFRIFFAPFGAVVVCLSVCHCFFFSLRIYPSLIVQHLSSL